MSNEIKIEEVNFDTSLEKEFKRQKAPIIKKACRHLKKVSVQQVIDNEADTIEYYNICEQCNRILSDDDMQKRKELLKKFKKLKK